ncbi:hypothetical protein J2T11_003562, partial [Paenarthrobacter nicotinovorans]|nr:hypothetical protein [Paenarthrobacter nicotinovorans]
TTDAAAQNSKPAENQTTTHGGAQQPGINFNQSKNNRYQQTWHTIEFSNNRHYRHHHQPHRATGSLRSNFSNLPEQPDLGKSALPRFQTRSPSPHPANARSKAHRFSGCHQGGWPPQFPAPSCLTRGDSEDITRPQHPTQIHPHTTQKPLKHKPNPPTPPQNHPKPSQNTAREPHHTNQPTQPPAVEHHPHERASTPNPRERERGSTPNTGDVSEHPSTQKGPATITVAGPFRASHQGS